MSTPIATVLSVTGQAWARDADGNLRVLEPGDILLEGETLITSDNGRVRLDFGDVEPVAIGPGQVVAMLAELDIDNPVSSDEASATDESIEALLAAIEAGEGDLLEVLDPTAAGLGGGGEGGGHTFVRLARINLDVDSLAYGYQPAQLDGLIEAQGEALALADEIDENGAPIATDDTGLGREGSPLTGNVLANDSDIDGDALTVTEFMIGDDIYQAGDTATIENIGSLTIGTDGSYTFTPVENWNGEVPAVSYTVSDGELSDTATLGLSVTPVNDTPVGNDDNATSAADDALTTPEDTVLIIDPASLLTNDSDVDGDELFISGVESEARDAQGNVVGSVTATSDNDGRVTQITFTPNADYNGDATFDYTVNDGAATDTATVTVAVTPVNDIPVGNDDNATSAADDALTTLEDTALIIDPATLLANDSDVDGDELFISGVESEARDAQGNVVGSVTATNDNDGRVTQITFTPNADYNGDATFDYTVNDGTAIDTATVTVDVTPVNDGPVGNDDNATDAANDALTTPEDTALIIDPATLLANDSDVDGDALFISGVESEARDGDNNIVGTVTTTSDNDGRVTQITFTPNADYNGDATFDYTVNDGAATDTATVTVAVTPVNDTPVGNDDNATDAANDALTTPEDTALIIDPATLLANDSDVDGDTLTITAVGNVSNGTVTLNDNGTITFTPDENYNGPAMFDYTVSDGAATDTAIVTVEVKPDNDAPVALNDINSVDVGGSDPATGNVLNNDSDIDGDPIRVSQVDGEAVADGGSISIDGNYGRLDINSDGGYTYTSNLSTPVLYGFNGSDAQLTGNLLNNFALSSDAQQRVSITNEGVGVKSEQLNHPTPDQINETGDVLVADLGASVSSVTFDVARLFNDESGGESGQWFAYGADGELVGSGQFGPESVAYEEGSNHKGTATINADDVSGDFQFIAFEGIDYQNGSDNAANDGGDYFITGITVQDAFDYTIVDDQGGDANATLTVDSSASLIGYQTPPDSAAEPEATITIDAITGDDVINSEEYEQTITITGSVGGDAREDDTVTLTVGASGNTYSGEVDADGTYSIEVDGGTLGEQTQVSASVSGQNAAGNSYEANASRDYTVNQSPDAANDALTTAEDTALAIAPATLLDNDQDADGNTLIITSVGNASNGTVVLNDDGTITFTPNANYNGDATFDYTVSDGDLSDTATVTVEVTPVNDAPVISSPVRGTLSEEGLEQGLADDSGAPDITNQTSYSGQLAISDIDGSEFSLTLTAPTTELFSNGEVVSWETNSDNELIGSAGEEEIIKVSIDNDGSYEVALLGPVDHSDVTTEDALSFDIGVTVSDGSDSAQSTITVTIEDDSPSVSQSEPVRATATDMPDTFTGHVSFAGNSGNSVNMTFADGNVEVTAKGFTSSTKLSLTQASVNQGAAGIGVASEASPYHNIANEVGYRELAGNDKGASEELTITLTDGKIAYGAKIDFEYMFGGELEVGVAEFYRDGNLISTQAFTSDESSGDYAADFKVEQGGFDTIVLKATDNGNDYGDGDNSDFTVSGITFTGSNSAQAIAFAEGTLSYAYGADGMGSLKLTGVQSVLQTANGSVVTIAINDPGTRLTGEDINGNLVFEVNLTPATGVWDYYQYQELQGDNNPIAFDYEATDADGDSVAGHISIESYVEPITLESSSSPLEGVAGLHGEYYGYNDDRVGSESDGKYAEDTDKRLHADDGSAIGGAHDPRFSNRDANLDTIGEVAAIIEGRAGAILGTGEHAADTATDAEFVATNVDYNINEGLGFGTNVDLGDNPMDESGGVTSGNLYDFLEHGGDEDSLEVTSGLGQTTDGIIRLSGSVYLEEGSYDIRVTGDDGFRLTIGGKEVASFDTITAPITTTEKGVSLSEGFQDIELLYWEQAERSVLKVELKKSGSDDSEYKVLSTDNFALFGEDPRPTLEDNQSLVRNDDGSFSILTGDDYQGDGSANEVIGSQANDTIDGGAGNDILRGAGGNDTLTGGLGADTFAWHLGDEDALGTPAIDTAAIDTVTDFDASEGDTLDLSDLLQNKEEDEAIADYLRADDDGSGTVLHVSSAGSLSSDPASTDQTIKLAGVDMGGKSSEAFIDDLVGKGQIDI